MHDQKTTQTFIPTNHTLSCFKSPRLGHIDLCGPIMPSTPTDNNYFLLVVDDIVNSCGWSYSNQKMRLSSVSKGSHPLPRWKEDASCELSILIEQESVTLTLSITPTPMKASGSHGGGRKWWWNTWRRIYTAVGRLIA